MPSYFFPCIRLRREGREIQLRAALKRKEWIAEAAAKQAVQGFNAAAEALVLDVLMHQPRSIFQGKASPLHHGEQNLV